MFNCERKKYQLKLTQKEEEPLTDKKLWRKMKKLFFSTHTYTCVREHTLEFG